MGTIEHSDVMVVMHRILDRADMNVRTSRLHPDPLVRQLAAARAEGYRMAASELGDLLLRSYDDVDASMEASRLVESTLSVKAQDEDSEVSEKALPVLRQGVQSQEGQPEALLRKPQGA